MKYKVGQVVKATCQINYSMEEIYGEIVNAGESQGSVREPMYFVETDEYVHCVPERNIINVITTGRLVH